MLIRKNVFLDEEHESFNLKIWFCDKVLGDAELLQETFLKWKFRMWESGVQLGIQKKKIKKFQARDQKDFFLFCHKLNAKKSF